MKAAGEGGNSKKNSSKSVQLHALLSFVVPMMDVPEIWTLVTILFFNLLRSLQCHCGQTGDLVACVTCQSANHQLQIFGQSSTPGAGGMAGTHGTGLNGLPGSHWRRRRRPSAMRRCQRRPTWKLKMHLDMGVQAIGWFWGFPFSL